MLRSYIDDASPITCDVEIEGYGESFRCGLPMSIETCSPKKLHWLGTQSSDSVESDVVTKVVFPLENYKELCSERKKIERFCKTMIIMEDFSFLLNSVN